MAGEEINTLCMKTWLERKGMERKEFERQGAGECTVQDGQNYECLRIIYVILNNNNNIHVQRSINQRSMQPL